MIRSELVDAVHQGHGGYSRRQARDLVDVVLDRITRRLALGEPVDISGFGRFEVVVSPARRGRHPVTGRRFQSTEARALRFRPARSLEERMNAPAAPWMDAAPADESWAEPCMSAEGPA